jgi:ubiquinone/menaquinone biosynthesis C-methylase UbiE
VSPRRPYLPAASLDVLLPVYDPIMRLLRFTAALPDLVAQAELQAGFRVLDIGCGTGTLAVMITSARPAIEITGIDPDARALARAERKARREGVPVRFDCGFADALPYPDASFDRVFSSMMLHHVARAERLGVLREARRVLTPDGRLEFLDFDRGDPARLMRDAGFAAVARVATRRTISGALGFYQASGCS